MRDPLEPSRSAERSTSSAQEAPADWTLETLLADYPWADEVRAGVAPEEFFWRLELDTTPEILWPRLIDTSRLNRALGLAAMQFEESGRELYGHGRPAGFEHRWVELPWNWVGERRVMAERAYSKGFSRHARVRYDLTPRAGKVVFTAYFGFIPRHWLFRWVLRIGMRSLRGRFEEVLRSLGEGGEALAPPTPDRDVLPPRTLSRIELIAEELTRRDISEAGLSRLLALIHGGDDIDVHRLQVRKLAHAWQIPERALLHLFLHATRLGLLELSWDVVCPHCRGTRRELATLGDVPKDASCEPCALEFGTDGPNAIEITFRIHPSIRDVPKQMFCSAQTAERRHVKLQQVLAPGEERRVEAPLAGGRFRSRTLGQPSFGYLDVAAEHTSGGELVTWRASAAPDDVCCGSELRLLLVNDTDEPATFIVEDVNWADEALRPAHLFCYQGFRDLFSEEYIGADVHLAIGEQVIMFSDIVGSTKLYLERGDPHAFAAVKKHFTEVFAIVDEHEGAVVKTIGDATMAAFSDTVKAIEAARVLHERFPVEAGTDAITLRVSINTGVCIAVNLNSNIDYFGNTVNLAAKLQLVAGAGDIVLSPDAWAAPGVQELAQREGAAFEAVAFEFDALGQTIEARRWATAKHARGRRKAG